MRIRFSEPGFTTVEKVVNADDLSDGRTMDVALDLASFSEQITVTATGSPTPQAQLGASVTVLESTKYQGTQEIHEGLRLVPGVNATQTGQAGGTTAVFIRGGGSDANKVLIDGIPVNDIGGNVEFANLASAAVGQVEVLRGPNSALYGADALAGVISLTTQRGSTPLPLLTYRINGGNFGTYQQEGAMSGRWSRFDYFSDYSRFNTSNTIADDRYHNGTFTGNYGWALTSKSSLRAMVHHDQVASGEPDAIELYGIPTDAEQTNEDAYFGVTWDYQTTTNWRNLVRYGGARLRSQYATFEPTGIPQYDDYDDLLGYLGNQVTIHGANGYTVSGQAQYQYVETYPNYYPGSTDKDFVYAQSNYRVNPHLLGLFAFRYEDERGYADSVTNSVERGNYSYTTELQGDIRSRLFYTLGAGLERNGLFGFAATPRASLAWQLSGSTKLRASFGKGIKEPAVFDQIDSLYALLKGMPAGSQPSGNQLIAQDHITPIGPEDSRSFDGGVDQYFLSGRSHLSLSLFHNEFTHGIEYIPPQGLTDLGVPSAIVTIAANTNYGATVNSKAYRAQGLETEFATQLSRDWFARAGYTWVDAKIQHSFTGDAIGPSYNPNFPTIPIGAYSPLIGARPFRIAPQDGYFQAGYRHARLFAVLSGTLVARRDDSDFLEYDANYGQTMLLPNRNLDSAYQRLDLASSYQASSKVAIEGSFQNLLSQHYSEAFGYPSLPFMFRLGMKITVGGESWPWK